MKVILGSDHGGYDVKHQIVQLLDEQGLETLDVGADGSASVDYPDYVDAVCHSVSGGDADFGVLVCTTGIGMSIAANRYPGIRAALCNNA
ncbi:MAG: RpiB/LacA/LacB family sugar-phosphate isomerase, partial [Kiritimatiellia bacterium]